MRNRFLSAIACMLMIALSCDACKIDVRLFAKTLNPFQIQLVVPALKLKTERITFTKSNVSRAMLIEGKECNRQHWTFKTWKRVGEDWVPAAERKVKLEGTGWIDVHINDFYMPTFHDRFNIFCSEGLCY